MLNIVRKDNRNLIRSIMLGSAALLAFDTGKPGWKMNAAGDAIEMKDGNPIWIDANGGEMVMQGDAIARANNEAKTHRIAKETAETKLAEFKGVDPTVALKAVDDMKKIDSKKLIDAGKVDEVKAEMQQQFTQQLNDAKTENEKLQGSVNTMIIDGAFAASDFIRNDVAVPRNMFEATYRNNFKVGADGKIEAYGKDGNRIWSKKHNGEYADADEALRILVDNDPNKDAILKAPEHRGSGGGGGGERGGKRTMRRAEFEKLAPAAQADYSAKVGTGEAALID